MVVSTGQRNGLSKRISWGPEAKGFAWAIIEAEGDLIMGSGTTLITAETTGRVCFGVELNPAYIDVAIDRWQQFTGANAVLAKTGETFAALKTKRLVTGPSAAS